MTQSISCFDRLNWVPRKGTLNLVCYLELCSDLAIAWNCDHRHGNKKCMVVETLENNQPRKLKRDSAAVTKVICTECILRRSRFSAYSILTMSQETKRYSPKVTS